MFILRCTYKTQGYDTTREFCVTADTRDAVFTQMDLKLTDATRNTTLRDIRVWVGEAAEEYTARSAWSLTPVSAAAKAAPRRPVDTDRIIDI